MWAERGGRSHTSPFMADLDVRMVRSTVTANGKTVDLAGLYHRQLHGTGQGAI